MERSGTLTIRDLDPDDVAALKAEAAATGRSLNRFVGEVLHRRARAARNRALLEAVAAAGHPPVDDLDAVAEVRAVRDEQDERDARIAENWETGR